MSTIGECDYEMKDTCSRESLCLQWHDHYGLHLHSINNFDVIFCKKCSFKHIIPLPSKRELEEIYQHEYYTQEKPLYLKRYREDLEWWDAVYEDRYDDFEKLLPDNRRRILDVGSGPGYFLLHGKKRGWEVLGIEPSEVAAAHSKALGVSIIEGFLDDGIAKELGSFDVINFGEVLEHIPDPKKLLDIANNLLLPSGLISVIVPNDYNPFQSSLISACEYKPWWVSPPHHINYFDFESLSLLLSSCGFDEVLREATFPIDIFLLMGENYINHDEQGRRCHSRRKSFEQNLKKSGLNHLKRELYKKFASLNIGREVYIVGKKRVK